MTPRISSARRSKLVVASRAHITGKIDGCAVSLTKTRPAGKQLISQR
jgi:hypothetical protein